MRNPTKARTAVAKNRSDDPMHGETAVRAADVALYLGLSYDKVLQLSAAGELPGAKIGGTWLYSPRAIRALLGED